ncbi:MAG TPA: glycoside hydrolase family 52 protein, partial [Fibrobacteraceae bacterium]|nr:glycoside hydrolase family 52 protein [Fibrobacteraceae bacterium]
MQTPFYNTQHAPVGAFASFTLGAKGAKGGLDLERAAPACENFWIGCEDRTGTTLQVLPFCEASPEPEKAFGKEPETPSRLPLHFFEPNEIQRNLTPGCDAWNTEDFHFSIYTQAPRLPNPDLEDSAELREGLVPAVLCEIRLDNRHGHTKRRVVFAWQGNHPQTIMRCMDAGSVVGIAQGMDRGFFGATGTWVAGQGMHVEEILEAVRQMDLQTLRHSIGSVGALIAEVPAGGVSVFHLVAAFFRNGPATTDKRFRYWYLHWWDSIEDVAAFALSSSDALIKAAHTANKLLGGQNLSLPRRWMLAQAVHSYYA